MQKVIGILLLISWVSISRGQKPAPPFIKSHKIYSCNESKCGPSEMPYKKFENGTFYVKFSVFDGCDDGPDTVAFDINQDTLKLYAFQKEAIGYYRPFMTDYLGKRKGPLNVFCECKFLIEIEIPNLIAEPRFFKNFEGIYSEREQKFVDLEWYKRTINKTWKNNSSSLTESEVQSLLGKKYNGPELRSICAKLGNDSIADNRSVDYLEDGLSVSFSQFGDINRIDFYTNFKGELPGKILWSENKDSIEKKIGLPEKIENDESREMKNGEWVDSVFHYRSYYFSRRLQLEYDEGQHVTDIILTSIFDK